MGRRSSLALLLAVLATPSVADGIAWELRAVDAHYGSREPATGSFTLDGESGRIAGTAASVSAEALGLRWRAGATRLAGNVAYRGFTQIAIPIRTTTALRIERLDLAVSPASRWPLGPATLGASAGLGLERIGRAIQGNGFSLATTEILRSSRAMVGLDLALPLNETLSASFAWRGLWPIGQRLKVVTFGELDDFTLQPRRMAAQVFSLSLRAEMAQGWYAVAVLESERLRFGSAPAVPIARQGVVNGFANYPGSLQKVEGLQFGVGRQY